MARKPAPRCGFFAPKWLSNGVDSSFPDSPHPDSYGRVTNPERYAVLHDEARSLIESLMTTYDVVAEPGELAVDFPEWKGAAGEVVRLVPAEGTAVSLVFTDFPGVVVLLGEWGREGFPSCGCDACDEKPNDVIVRMREWIESAVAGEYEETLTRGWLGRGSAVTHVPGSWSSTSRLGPAEGRHLGKPGSHKWPPWPRR